MTLESALVTALLLLIVLGAFEYGMAFRSFLGVTSASREGARVGASVGEGETSGPGSDRDADCRILEAAAAALQSSNENEVVRVHIFKHDPDTGTDVAENRYRPFIAGDDSDLLVCTNWFEEVHNWDESTRDSSASNRDWLAVEVEYEHAWITGFAWWNGTVNWSNRSTMRIEPVSYG